MAKKVSLPSRMRALNLRVNVRWKNAVNSWPAVDLCDSYDTASWSEWITSVSTVISSAYITQYTVRWRVLKNEIWCVWKAEIDALSRYRRNYYLRQWSLFSLGTIWVLTEGSDRCLSRHRQNYYLRQWYSFSLRTIWVLIESSDRCLSRHRLNACWWQCV
jgi:hypothetical protein